MRSVIFKHGATELQDDCVDIQDAPSSSTQKPLQPQAHVLSADGQKRKVINAQSVVHKKDADKTFIIEENFKQDIKKPVAYVFPTLAEKEDNIQKILDENANEHHDRFDLNQQNSLQEPPSQPSLQQELQDDASLVKAPNEMGSFYNDMIQKSIQESSRILEQAHAKAQEDYSKMMEQGRLSLENERKEAVTQGISEGTRSQIANIRLCIEQLEHAVANIEGRQENYFANCEQDLKWLAIEIAAKVLNHEISVDDAVLYPMVHKALEKQKNAKWLTLEISEDAPNLLQKLSDELSRGENTIEISTTSSPVDTCKIQTHEGFIDASLFRQLENLKEYFMQDI